MTIYRKTQGATFERFEETPFPDLERVLEDWIEASPHVLLDGEPIAIWGRQPRSGEGKYLDLLGVDEQGATVIIELKRGEAPRSVVAQTLEYAAWVHSLSLEAMDEIARQYADQQGIKAEGIEDLYAATFETEEDDEDATGRLTFNAHQRLVIVAESFSPEVEQTLRYLRTIHGVDISGVRFGVHQAGGELLLDVDVVIGREEVASAAGKASRQPRRLSDDEIRDKVETAFLKGAVTALEEWVLGTGIEGLGIGHGRKSNRRILYKGRRILGWYFTRNWMYFRAPGATEEDAAYLRKGLSKPDSVQQVKNGYRFHVVNAQDLETVKNYVVERVGVES